MIRIAIVQFPGSNCERETALAVKRAGMEPVEVLWNTPNEKLTEYDGYILVGGFSYEDRSRAGVMAAMDPIMQGIRREANAGKAVLGICNGAQILVESGLVPGLNENCAAIALTDNQRNQAGRVIGTGFYNAWVHVRVADTEPLTAFTKTLSKEQIMRIPVAHAEGRFVIPPALLAEMHAQGMCVFQYCDANGKIDAAFPINPNGSVDNLAAVSNRAGNVLAMMPHPERSPEGDPIFQAMRAYIEQGHVQSVRPLRYEARPIKPIPYRVPTGSHECITGLLIADNQAVSVENVFKQHGISARIRRYEHWEIACDSMAVVTDMQSEGFWFNPHKSYSIQPLHFAGDANRVSVLVQPNVDPFGAKRLQQFRDRFDANTLRDLRYGVLWQIETAPEHREAVLTSPLLYNPYSHTAWIYST